MKTNGHNNKISVLTTVHFDLRRLKTTWIDSISNQIFFAESTFSVRTKSRGLWMHNFFFFFTNLSLLRDPISEFQIPVFSEVKSNKKTEINLKKNLFKNKTKKNQENRFIKSLWYLNLYLWTNIVSIHLQFKYH